MVAATLHVIIVGGSARHSYNTSGNITLDRIWTDGRAAGTGPNIQTALDEKILRCQSSLFKIGLMSALHELAANTARMFRVNCVVECDPPVLFHEHSVATHLYRIAQEAVSNAIKHGRARHIRIGLKRAGNRNILSIKDDGKGIPKVLPENKGMGLRIMQYRAGMIGGAAMVERDLEGGTRVICSVPRTSLEEERPKHEG